MVKAHCEPDDVLGQLVAKAVAYGAEGLEIEYKDGHEQVCAMKGSFGVGIARFPSLSDEARCLHDHLHAIRRKARRITTDAGEFLLRASTYDSFGETAYRVQIHTLTQQAGCADPRTSGHTPQCRRG